MKSTELVTEFRHEIGANVKRARKQQGVSQKELGLLINLHRSAVSRIEHGTCGMTVDTLALIASALNIPAASLVSEFESPEGGELMPVHFSMPKHDL